MRLSQEWLLTLLLLALYLHDAVTFTGADTAFLVRSPWTGWVARFPTARFTLAHRHVFLPPLFPPATPVFSLRWTEGGAQVADRRVEDIAATLGTVSLASALCFVAVLALTPLVLLTGQSTFVILFTMAIAYLTVVGCVLALWGVRRRLDLPRAACIKLTAEMLLCPPVAANLTRRITQPMRLGEAFIPAARRLLGERAWEQAREDLHARVQVRFEEVQPGSPAHRELELLEAQLR